MRRATTMTVTIGSAFEGGRDTVHHLALPLDGRAAWYLGDRYPSAQVLADYYAGEYCDSGTVSVRSDLGERGRVVRSVVAG